ncbi:MAG: hypothetical protein ABEI74_01905 [Candidatus Pacearchaeota archaeon]
MGIKEFMNNDLVKNTLIPVIIGGFIGSGAFHYANLPETYPIHNSNIEFKSDRFLGSGNSPSDHGEIYNETTGTAYNIAGDFRLSEDNIKEHYDLESVTFDGKTYSMADTSVYGSPVVKKALQKYEERVNDFIDIAQEKKFGKKNIESKLDKPE